MKRAFTLVELLLVMAIVLSVLVLSGPMYSRFLGQNAAANTTDQIVQSLRKAQFYAMESRKSGTNGWGVNYGSNLLTLYQGANYAGRNAALDEKFDINTSLTVTSFDVNFARISGLPGSTPTITITGSQGTTKAVTVNSQGRVSR
ncbi:MAG: hypothetical protein G01um101416_825 [Microgenomates group bacterium Gr01-1014_16]|nr:MAG: hypothetical protein G01um101416_825 [Microgenomates group bacterium Gr01-1014_16]